MLRRTHFITVAFAAATFASGCLSSIGTDYGPQGGSPDPGMTSGTGNGDRGSGGGDTVGGGGGGGQDAGAVASPDLSGPPAQMGTLALLLNSTSESLRLNESKEVDVTVTPGGGFSGNVVYSLEGAPAGVTAVFNPAGGMISAATTVKMTITTTGDAKVGNGSALAVKAVSGTISGTAPLTLDVKAELLVTIPKGVDIGTSAAPNLTAFGAQSIPTIFVAPGTKVTFVNADSINHEIHSDGTLGIAHEGGPLMANEANAYTQTFNAAGTFNFRCHIHPNMKGQIVVKAQ